MESTIFKNKKPQFFYPEKKEKPFSSSTKNTR